MADKKMSPRVFLFPGSFDPPSLGHMDIIERASKMCDKLILGVMENIHKSKKSFSAEERKTLLMTLCRVYPNVEVITFEGLVAEYVDRHGIHFLIRGMRSYGDFEYESRLAIANQQLCGVDTLFLIAKPQYAHICSSLIHEIACFGHRLHHFVPELIEDAVYTRLTAPDLQKME